jgi:AcrR family transcriptional regulator
VIDIPKIIENIRGDIMRCAEIILKTDGYNAMSIRRIARECKTAVGTIYNYFESKDDLVANIILKDWLNAVSRMTEMVNSSKNYADGAVGIYLEIQKFESVYKNVWKQYSETVGSHGIILDHHMQLRAQISKLLDLLAKSTGCERLCESSPIIAEAIIAATLQQDMNELTIRRFAELL